MKWQVLSTPLINTSSPLLYNKHAEIAKLQSSGEQTMAVGLTVARRHSNKQGVQHGCAVTFLKVQRLFFALSTEFSKKNVAF